MKLPRKLTRNLPPSLTLMPLAHPLDLVMNLDHPGGAALRRMSKVPVLRGRMGMMTVTMVGVVVVVGGEGVVGGGKGVAGEVALAELSGVGEGAEGGVGARIRGSSLQKGSGVVTRTTTLRTVRSRNCFSEGSARWTWTTFIKASIA